MAINKKLIHFKNKQTFEQEVANGNILDTSIVFIQDTQQIYTHGTFYDCNIDKKIYVLDIDTSAESGTLTQEQYDAVLNCIFLIVDGICFENTGSSSYVYIFQSIINDGTSSIVFQLNIWSDLTWEINVTEYVNPTYDGDGTQFLSDDGTYKEITIPTKVSELENDVPYALKSDVEVEVENGVYAIKSDGSLCTVEEADSTCIAVALVQGEHKFMIEKNGEANTTSIQAAYTADGASNTGYTYFYWGMNGSDNANITNYTQVGGNSSSWSWGYLPQASGSYASTSNNLSSDITTWTSGTALGDFNGKANTAAIQAASDTDTYTTYANMGTYCTKFNQTPSENQGYTDWYIPACGQLSLMFLNMTDINAALTKIGGTTLASRYYWSSSEYSSNGGWYVGFSLGYVYGYGKDGNSRVRFIRDLSIPSVKDRISTLESTKQNKNLYFENVSASTWVEDATYADYGYRCDITCEGVTEDMYAEVVFDLEQAVSGEYAPVCETGDNIVSIWSSSNESITIPTIIVEQ